MIASLGPLETILINVLFWLFVSMVFAWFGTKVSAARFRPGAKLFRKRRWENEGKTYEQLFRIRRWKDRLPDLGGIFAGGFSKGRLRSNSPEYLDRFAVETCRGEAVHWAAMLLGPVTILWNPLWAALVMTVYGILANLPCIFAQRYNRIRLARLLERGRNSEGTDS